MVRRSLKNEPQIAPGGEAPAADLQWLALATHAHRERAAEENLRRQGYATYCPVIQKSVRHARKSQLVLRPLFPGYIFAGVAPDASWKTMHSTIGVRRVICNGERPCILGSDFVAALRARELGGVIVKPVHPYQQGQQVRLTSGAFGGLVATIIEVDEEKRLVLLLELLNQSVRVHTDIHAVRELNANG